ncbi:hypothetical protein K7N96_004685, partial [Salmonella enterica]|nr:hypothetical protein [Salmonella enterica]EIA5960662.1 hypothetical protein [Salmonella enterica]EIS4018871.1 hypothetical protein [Salmonella enterica]ELF2249187.1 hypothetical protein [Salmonella enterica]ELT4714616.1 hypothetical protein [Salmonella enterica]
GNVAATLTYVDTSGKLLSKEARAGTTTIAVGKAVKQTVDTRFYPQVHVCVSNLSASGFIVPGQTEVKLCDGSGHAIHSGSGYKVSATGMSAAGCSVHGGGVCPSDNTGVNADFTNLTGDDIWALGRGIVTFSISDTYAGQKMTSKFTTGKLAVYGELNSHFGTTNLGQSKDLFHHQDALQFCQSVFGDPHWTQADAAQAVEEVVTAGGARTGSNTTGLSMLKGLYTGPITKVIRTGGDTNPEIFVDGIAEDAQSSGGCRHEDCGTKTPGTEYPAGLVFVNGSRYAATAWLMERDSIDAGTSSFGAHLHRITNWNLSDAYFVNNWPGTPYTAHKGNGDTTYPYVTQVNYITGYICAASLH